jgi:ribose transport system substrate-binding protein
MAAFKRAAAGAAVLAAFAAVGCGGSDDETSATSSPKAKPTEAGTAAGLGPTAADPKIKVAKKTIGVVDLTRASPIDNNTDLTIEAATKALGWDVKIIDAQGDPQQVARAAQTLVNSKVDGLITLSVDAPLIKQSLEQARSQKIPTCAVQGGQAPTEDYDAQYTENERDWGIKSAQFFVEQNPEAKIIMLKSTTIFAGKERVAGFEEGINAAPGAKIVFGPEIDLTDPVGSTTAAVENGLKAHPDATAVWPAYDLMVDPAVSALKRSGKSDVVTMGQFATPPMVKSLTGGTAVKSLVINPISKGGATCIDQFLKVFEKGATMDRDALEKLGGLENTVLTEDELKAQLVPGVPDDAAVDRVNPPGKILEPFIASWQKDYPAGS